MIWFAWLSRACRPSRLPRQPPYFPALAAAFGLLCNDFLWSLIMNITIYSGVLEVQLLETVNLYEDSLEEEFRGNDSSVFLFTNVQLTQQVRKGWIYMFGFRRRTVVDVERAPSQIFTVCHSQSNSVFLGPIFFCLPSYCLLFFCLSLRGSLFVWRDNNFVHIKRAWCLMA